MVAPQATAARDRLRSKLATISTAADIDRTIPPNAIKCPHSHISVSTVHWIISQINDLSKCSVKRPPMPDQLDVDN